MWLYQLKWYSTWNDSSNYFQLFSGQSCSEPFTECTHECHWLTGTKTFSLIWLHVAPLSSCKILNPHLQILFSKYILIMSLILMLFFNQNIHRHAGYGRKRNISMETARSLLAMNDVSFCTEHWDMVTIAVGLKLK